MTKSAVKKVFPVIFALTVFVFLVLPLLTEAQLGGIPNINRDIILKAFRTIVGYLAIGLGIGSMLLGLFRMGTSIGDPRILEEAKQKLMWGVIGVALGSFLLTMQPGLVQNIGFTEMMGYVSSWLAYMSWMVAFIVFVLSVFKIATSEGDSKMLSEGKTGLVWAAIAAAIGAVLNVWGNVYNWLTTGAWTGG